MRGHVRRDDDGGGGAHCHDHDHGHLPLHLQHLQHSQSW